MSIFKTAVQLLRETVKEWIEDGGAHIAAALAYYAVFSLSPLLIIVSLTLGLVADPTTLETSLVRDLQPTIGEQAANLIRSMLRSNAGTTDILGTVVWLGIIVWGASGMFAQLQNALNKIWEVRAKPGRPPWVLVKNRFQSFGIVILTRRYRVPFPAPALVQYRDERDSVGFHRDRELRWLDDTVIGVATFGAHRPWLMRPIGGNRYALDDDLADAIDLSPTSGDLLVMGGRSQADWLHAVPKVRGRVRSRISAQWRWTSKRGRRDTNPGFAAPRHFSR